MTSQPPMLKYPRTHHIEGSKLQPGDEDLSQVPVADLKGIPLVIEEKLDGANAAFSFAPDGSLLLQSRGHYLTGGPREKHFGPFKTWASAHQSALRDVIGDRYIVYGEWLYAKHTVFYDRLPHWFMEFDCWDRKENAFLSTVRRQRLLQSLPVQPVPVIYEGVVRDVEQLRSLILPSLYKSGRWRDELRNRAEAANLEVARVLRQTDSSDEAEGLYIKDEAKGCVVGRYKFIRPSFAQSVESSDGHWLNRPIIENGLAHGVDIFDHG